VHSLLKSRWHQGNASRVFDPTLLRVRLGLNWGRTIAHGGGISEPGLSFARVWVRRKNGAIAVDSRCTVWILFFGGYRGADGTLRCDPRSCYRCLVGYSDLHETLEPLDARQDEDMKGNLHLALSMELPLQIMNVFPEATELLILNSRKQHRVATAPVN